MFNTNLAEDSLIILQGGRVFTAAQFIFKIKLLFLLSGAFPYACAALA